MREKKEKLWNQPDGTHLVRFLRNPPAVYSDQNKNIEYPTSDGIKAKCFTDYYAHSIHQAIPLAQKPVAQINPATLISAPKFDAPFEHPIHDAEC